MTPERWQQITELFEGALRRGADERASFLADACDGDDELRREVEAMLASHERAASFIEEPAMTVVAKLITAETRQSLLGQRVLHYQVLSLLGAGGMGEVYLAMDTKLGRRVALKLLPDDLSRDEQRVRRFEQEARAASSLNHPNILTIHEIGRMDSRHFIATEYIEGETLRRHLIGEGMGPGPALDIAIQVASALAAAHEAGIVHRDIKPENIMVRRDRIVKVLDFGLAKLDERRSPQVNTQTPTEAKVQTEPGVLMGTVNYMSPEQARGLEVDARTDIWSLGCVLYEMTAGRVPFEGETPTDGLSLILQKEPPPLAHYAPEAPEELERIVAKSLVKDRDGRYQTVKDLLIDLQRLRRRLDVEAELERTAPPDAGGDVAGTAGGGPNITAAVLSRLTDVAGAEHTTSSAEYLFSEVKRNRRGVLLVVAALAVAAIAFYFYSTRAVQTIHSLAVLPLVNVGGDPETEYLSDGIAESLINSLSQLPNLKVMSLNSVLRYKGSAPDAQTVGRELGVEAVLTGKITQRGDSLSISVELVRARDNTHIWGEQYNRKLSDLLAVQGEISREVLEKLRLRLTGEQEKTATKRYTENTEAYQLYLKGRYHWNKRTLDDIWKGLDHFQRAIELDPSYALAYSGVADSYFAMVLGGPFMPGSREPLTPSEARVKSLAAARRAVELDPNLAEAHTSLGGVLEWFEWDDAGAEREYKRALELNPDYATAHQRYGVFLGTTAGRSDEGAAELKRALQLDPASLPINADLGFNYYGARRYDKAIEQARKTVELDPNWPRARFLLAQCYTEKGMYDEALREMEKMRLPRQGPNFVRVYVLMGRREEGLKILAEMKERSKRQYVGPFSFANVYASLGDKERAFEYLEKAFAERSPMLRNIRKIPAYDDLHSDPRFTDLLKRIGLPS